MVIDKIEENEAKLISTVHTLSIAEINNNVLTARQIDTKGKIVDNFKLTK